MNRTADLQFTVIVADEIYTNELTPVTAVPWPDKFTNKILPYASTKFSSDALIWDFGDGTTYTGVSAVHVYDWPGVYTIKLTIIDESGEPVTSTTQETLIVKDFIPSQSGFRDLIDVIDIPSGRLVNPITVDFTMSWQQYAQKPRKAPLCNDGKQHLMNKGVAPGYWMCGENHPGDEQVQQPDVTEFPIYTFNLYASGADAKPLNFDLYEKDKYSHLDLDWSFHSTTPAISSQPTDSIQVTRTDFLTGNSGDANTYDLLYYKRSENNEYIQTTPADPQGVFVGLSGNMSFFYRDDVTKCNTSRDSPVLISVELDEKKIYDQLTVNKRNKSTQKYVNNKPLVINNVKPRVNEVIQLGVTTIGLPEFQIGENKWENSIINFTVTLQDAFEFNILDSKQFNSFGANLTGSDIQIELVDAETSQTIPTSSYEYCIDARELSTLGYFKGTLKCRGAKERVKLKATTVYNQISGYKTDTIVPWLNTYRPKFIGTGTEELPQVTESGSLYRYYYSEVTTYNSSQLYDNFTRSFTGKSNYVDTNGIISDVIVIHPGENLTQPPKISIEDPTGSGAVLLPRFNKDGGIISDIIVLSGGEKYSLEPVLYFTLADANATVPNAVAVVDFNHQVELIAVQPADPGIIEPKTWALEVGESGNDNKPPRIVEVTSRGEVMRSRPLSAMTTTPGTPLDIKLDNNGDIYLATENKVIQVGSNDLELTNIYDDNAGGTGSFEYITDPTNPVILEVDLVDIYISNTNHIYKLNKINNELQASANIANRIDDVLLHYNGSIYVKTNLPSIITLDKNDLTIKNTVELPPGEYSTMTTTINGLLYLIKDGRYLVEINDQKISVRDVYDFSSLADITTLAGDSRGTIWVPDNGSRKLWAVDVIENKILGLNDNIGSFEYGKVNYSLYPTPPDGDVTGHILKASGDWTGFKWLQKFGLIQPGEKTLIGYSSEFNINSQSGTYNIRKLNESHNQAATIKSYATQPWLGDQHNLWDQAVLSVVGDDKSEPSSLGKQVYERIANFAPNNTDIDDCNIDSIHNHCLLYDVDIQMYNLNYPPTLKRVMDLCSIKHSRLFGAFDYSTNNFDMYTDYTMQDTRENLGRELDINSTVLLPGEKIVAYERFSKIYTPITITTPTSGSLDEYNNIVNIGEDTTLVSEENRGWPLSAYSVYWQWNLVAPPSVSGVDITDYYAFYSYNKTTTAAQVEGVIDWENPQTTLLPSMSSYNNWSKDFGILDNVIEHQLRVGLDLFGVDIICTDTDNDGISDYLDDDWDNDNTPNVDDDFPFDPTEDTDTDGDGTGDNEDTDDDDDGTPDTDDTFPNDPTEDTDTDGDGTGDNEDNDDDDDGTPDTDDDFPFDPTEDTDTDGDGTGDNEDTDDDDDGTPDTDDAFPKDPTEDTDTDGDGTGDNEDTDDDDDGTPDTDDAFPKNPAEDTDTDGDGTGDNEDTDDDDDGTPDTDDDFPKNPAEDTDTDGDGTGDNEDTDDDDDGTPDTDDDFPKDPTEDTDTDGDGTGDNEDTDDDDDGLPDIDDTFPKDPDKTFTLAGCYTHSENHPNLGDMGPEMTLTEFRDQEFACVYERFYRLGYISDSEAYLQETGQNNIEFTENCTSTGNDVDIITSIYFRGSEGTIDWNQKYNNTDIDRYQVFNARAATVIPRVYIYRLDSNGDIPDLANGLGRNNNLFELSHISFIGGNAYVYVTTPINWRDPGAGTYFKGEWCYKIVPTPDTDFDGDGIGDLDDPDDDNDGTPDVDDAFPEDPTEDSDEDGDGVGDNTDMLRPVVDTELVQDNFLLAPVADVVSADVEVVLVPTWLYVNIAYGDLTPGSTNTLTFDFRPNIDLPAGQTIRLIGLVDFLTADNSALPLGGASSSLFGSSAQWEQSTGTLTLTVAPGQIVPTNSITYLTFDLVNPAVIPNHQLTLISP